MNALSFVSLSPQQQHAMILAMVVRNAMEDFHVKHLSDAQMAELNPIIRQALYDGMLLMKNVEHQRMPIGWVYLVDMIPDYWEIPGQDGSMQDRKTAA